VQKSYQKEWSFPGGMLKIGESWKQAAVRETVEEVGIQLDEGGLSFVKKVIGDLGPRNRNHLYEVELTNQVDVKVDGREIVRAEFVLLSDALQKNINENVQEYLKSLSDR
jgi:ADP-ribose pyrophosphatase YjhB (NUDIX family)